MKPFGQWLAAVCIAYFFPSCDDGKKAPNKASQGPLFSWQELRESAAAVREKATEDFVLVAFAAEWSLLSGRAFRNTLNDPQTLTFLSSHSVAGYIADCTTADSEGMKEYKIQGV